ncbi:hypothetical protein BDZ85DRAFT_254424 [Elsinoe ampelina]|uniref:Uncharacterized protein n=1 Tax=Elsinoe ampelina TaxID=302913 RepID=A0A6A6GPB0_9PEZI|nr:hypothetical protein BDZ85DRAFT_254424 [Elsinoe ampelina]
MQLCSQCFIITSFIPAASMHLRGSYRFWSTPMSAHHALHLALSSGQSPASRPHQIRPTTSDSSGRPSTQRVRPRA